MTTQELIQAIMSASVSDLAHIRALLRIPDDNTYGRCKMNELPKNVGELWNRAEQRVESKK
jgi:hypothetical protein